MLTQLYSWYISTFCNYYKLTLYVPAVYGLHFPAVMVAGKCHTHREIYKATDKVCYIPVVKTAKDA